MSRSNAERIDSFVLRGPNSVITSSDSESLTGLYQSHDMRLMQISGFGGAEIVGGDKQNPILIRWYMNEGILFWEDSPNHFAQHR